MPSNQATMAREDGAAAEAARRFVELQSQVLAYYGVKATSRFVELARPAMRAHVLEAGQGQPVVLFHGGDGEAVNWAPLLKPLQEQVHVFAVDRPGFGLSDAFDYRDTNLREHCSDFVVSLLDALHLESATLIGGSMGGFFVLTAGIDHPDRVRGIVLAGAAVGTTREMGEMMKKICSSPEAAVEFMRGRDNMQAQKDQYRNMFNVDPGIVPDIYYEARIAGLRLPSEQGTWATMLVRLADGNGIRPEVYIFDELSRIKAPTLVLWGDRDMAPPEAGQAAAGVIPNGQFVRMEGGGHFPQIEAPELMAKTIIDFLQGS
jgi:pimeloyl-ACP methyl ester carboxylesterase